MGIEYGFTQPIEMRVSEMLTGVRGDLAIDIFGSNNDELEKIAIEIKTLLEKIKGSSDVYKKANEGVEYFELSFNKKAMAYHNIEQQEINNFLKVLCEPVRNVAGQFRSGLYNQTTCTQGG